MVERKIYEALADAFHAEGVKVLFCLTGDGNMHWEADMTSRHRVFSVHVRHEHAACAMASAHARATGDVGVASVTCGPGLTQIMTALATAAQARIPLVVMAGEDPMHAAWYNQRIDQAPFVTAAGAHYIAARSARVINGCVQEAFITARSERRPVVIAVPLDLQKEAAAPGAYVPSRDLMPQPRPRVPHPDDVAAGLERIRSARRVVVLAGRGAIASGAREACVRLAESLDGALATTLPARGLFSGHPRDIGVTGGYAHVAARDALGAADLVVAVGASLSQFTSDQNRQFAPAAVLQIDPSPTLPKQGQVPSGSFIVADAKLALDEINAALSSDPPRAAADWDIPAVSHRVHTEPPDPDGGPPTDGLDPRDVVAALSSQTNPRWAHVTGSGHCAFYTAHLYHRAPEDFLTIREFGAIGNGLSYAMGRWASRPEQPVLLTEGDGGFLMHVQELETVMRYGMKILICVLNDGAYGSEVHKLRADGVSDEGAIFGRGDIASIARGFGLEGHTVTSLDQIPALARAFDATHRPTLWDVHVSDRVISPPMRRMVQKA